MHVPHSFTDGKHKPLSCILPCSLSSMFFFLLILLFLASGYSLVSNRFLILLLLLLLDPGPGLSCTSTGLLIAHY